MREKGFVSNRIFDALACGAFIISDQVKSAGEINNYIATYSDKKELEELVKYYLENIKERIALGELGKKYVIKHHTFEARAIEFSRVFEQEDTLEKSN